MNLTTITPDAYGRDAERGSEEGGHEGASIRFYILEVGFAITCSNLRSSCQQRVIAESSEYKHQEPHLPFYSRTLSCVLEPPYLPHNSGRHPATQRLLFAVRSCTFFVYTIKRV